MIVDPYKHFFKFPFLDRNYASEKALPTIKGGIALEYKDLKREASICRGYRNNFFCINLRQLG